MKINDYNIKKKALEPLIATILLIVVSVILVTIVLTWGKEFSTSSLNKTNNFAELKASDATHFIYPKSAVDGVMQFTYSPPAEIKQDINVTHYRVINIPEMTEPIALSEPKILSPSLNILELPCLYEYSTTTPDLYIQLITADNTYIDIKTRDAGMVCSSGGTGTEEDPIVICNAEDLNNVRNDLDANYALGKDIDLQCFSRQDAYGWEPIGTSENSFTGGFDGLNNTIKSVYIYRPEIYNVGLFGVVRNSEIKNLGVVDVNVTGYTSVGGLVGNAESDFYNSYSKGVVQGFGDVGGLIGLFSGGTISNCHSAGSVVGDNSNIGGLFGGWYSFVPTLIENCFSTSDVSGRSYVGGLIGIYEEDGGAAQIKNCYATGDVTVISHGGGGLIGYYDMGIQSSYSIGSVSNVEDTGGLIGQGSSDTTISYWNTETSGQETSDGGEGKTTTEMKTRGIFTDWDFSTVWAIDSTKNDGYPYLRNNPPR